MLATMPMDCGHGRRSGIWVSPLVHKNTIIDTSALKIDERPFAGRDVFPADSVLVVVSPAMHVHLTEKANARRYPVGGPVVAAELINEACWSDPTLAARLKWTP